MGYFVRHGIGGTSVPLADLKPRHTRGCPVRRTNEERLAQAAVTDGKDDRSR